MTHDGSFGIWGVHPDNDPDYVETEECWQCGGDGGWNSCMEDCCPAIGGEEGCTDDACWRVCGNCKGAGSITWRP